jgi:hypothetical protein
MLLVKSTIEPDGSCRWSSALFVLAVCHGAVDPFADSMRVLSRFYQGQVTNESDKNIL